MPIDSTHDRPSGGIAVRGRGVQRGCDRQRFSSLVGHLCTAARFEHRRELFRELIGHLLQFPIADRLGQRSSHCADEFGDVVRVSLTSIDDPLKELLALEGGRLVAFGITKRFRERVGEIGGEIGRLSRAETLAECFERRGRHRSCLRRPDVCPPLDDLEKLPFLLILVEPEQLLEFVGKLLFDGPDFLGVARRSHCIDDDATV